MYTLAYMYERTKCEYWSPEDRELERQALLEQERLCRQIIKGGGTVTRRSAPLYICYLAQMDGGGDGFIMQLVARYVPIPHNMRCSLLPVSCLEFKRVFSSLTPEQQAEFGRILRTPIEVHRCRLHRVVDQMFPEGNIPTSEHIRCRVRASR